MVHPLTLFREHNPLPRWVMTVRLMKLDKSHSAAFLEWVELVAELERVAALLQWAVVPVLELNK